MEVAPTAARDELRDSSDAVTGTPAMTVAERFMVGLAVASLFTWVLPLVGLPVSIVGFVLSVRALRADGGRRALVAIIVLVVGLLLTVVNAALGSFLYFLGG
mgnify:CR=1 FL=1